MDDVEEQREKNSGENGEGITILVSSRLSFTTE